MTRMNFGRTSGIVVDVCREHGTWFDQGELDAVLEFVRDGGVEAEVAALPDLAKHAGDESAIRAMEAELTLGAMHEKRSVERAAEIADDLLYLLTGLSTRSIRRTE